MRRPAAILRLALAAALVTVACGGGTSAGPLHNAVPRARLAAPLYAPIGEPVVLDAGDSWDPDGAVVEYAFSFSDGSRQVTLPVAEVTHTFSQPGAYEVAVIVRDDQGLLGRATQLVVVRQDPAACGESSDCSLGAECRCSFGDCEARGRLCYAVGAGISSGVAECALDADCGAGLACRAGLCLTGPADAATP